METAAQSRSPWSLGAGSTTLLALTILGVVPGLATQIQVQRLVEVVAVDDRLNQFWPGDRFLLDFTLQDTVADSDASAQFGLFPGLVSGLSLSPEPNNVGDWPGGAFDVGGTALLSTLSAQDSIRWVLPGTAVAPDLLNPVRELEIRFAWPDGISDQGLGQSFSTQLGATPFDVPPALMTFHRLTFDDLDAPPEIIHVSFRDVTDLIFADAFENWLAITTNDGLQTLVVNSERAIQFQVSVPGTDAEEEVEIALAADQGARLTLPVTIGLDFSIGDGSADLELMVFRGSLADVNASLGGGSGGVQWTPAAAFVGDAALTAEVDDLGNAGQWVSRSVTHRWATTYANTNTAPTISAIGDRAIPVNGQDVVAFTVEDDQTQPGNLELSLSVSYPDVAHPVAVSFDFSGSDADRTVTLRPAKNDTGVVSLTVRVSDGSMSAEDQFLLTVGSF